MFRFLDTCGATFNPKRQVPGPIRDTHATGEE
jgi:hypothetical protein